MSESIALYIDGVMTKINDKNQVFIFVNDVWIKSAKPADELTEFFRKQEKINITDKTYCNKQRKGQYHD